MQTKIRNYEEATKWIREEIEQRKTTTMFESLMRRVAARQTRVSAYIY